jgi:hypothetical protein
VKLYSHPGNDLTHRFPLIVEALARVRSRSCIIDGEAVACDDSGDKEATRLSAETDRGMARRASRLSEPMLPLPPGFVPPLPADQGAAAADREEWLVPDLNSTSLLQH